MHRPGFLVQRSLLDLHEDRRLALFLRGTAKEHFVPANVPLQIAQSLQLHLGKKYPRTEKPSNLVNTFAPRVQITFLSLMKSRDEATTLV